MTVQHPTQPVASDRCEERRLGQKIECQAGVIRQEPLEPCALP